MVLDGENRFEFSLGPVNFEMSGRHSSRCFNLIFRQMLLELSGKITRFQQKKNDV